jgi:hypothetical protein
MPVEVMADTAGMLAGKLSEDMPGAAMSGVDPLVSVLAVEVVNNLRGQRADTGAMQLTHIIGMAVVAGEAVTGEEAITGIRPLDIRWAITAWAMAIHPTELAITVIPTVGTMVRTTDTILTATDTGRP